MEIKNEGRLKLEGKYDRVAAGLQARGDQELYRLARDAAVKADAGGPVKATVKSTWEEMGVTIDAIRNMVFVRTDLPPEKSRGGIIIPAMYQSFYEGPFHLRLQSALVLSTGPKAKAVHKGERVAFQRKFFAYYKQLHDGSYMGWIREPDIAGILREGAQVGRRIAFPQGDNAVVDV